MKIQAKQIHKLISGYITVNSKLVSVGSSSITINSELATALTTAGFMSGVVVLTESVAENIAGIPTVSSTNFVEISINPALTKLYFNSKEIYGRIVKSGTDWQVNFYYFNASGVETPYTFINNYNLRLNIPYRFELKSLPTDFVLKLRYDNLFGDMGKFDNTHTDPLLNVKVGLGAGYSISTGAENTLFGYRAGYNLTTENGNVFIGYKAGENETDSNRLYVSNSNTNFPLIFGDFNMKVIDINGELFVEEDLTSVADFYAFQRIFYSADNVNVPQTFILTIEDDIIKKQTASSVDQWEIEELTVTGLNTLSDLTFTPSDVNKTSLNVNGETIFHLGTTPFNIVGKVITWDSGVAGYSLEITDKVVVKYLK